jgi:hypothetical protein
MIKQITPSMHTGEHCSISVILQFQVGQHKFTKWVNTLPVVAYAHAGRTTKPLRGNLKPNKNHQT